MAVGTSADVVSFSPDLVSLEALDAMDDATSNMMLANALDLSAELVGAASLSIPVFPDVDMTDETEGVVLPGTVFPTTDVTVTPDTKKAVNIPLTDYARATANQELMNGYGRQAGREASRLLDTSIAGVYTETAHAPIDAGIGVDIDEADIIAAKGLLDGANAPGQGRKLVLYHNQYNAILAIPGLVRFDAVGKAGDANAIVSGVVGSLHGFLLSLDQNMVDAGARRHNVALVNNGNRAESAVAYGMATFKAMISNTLHVGNLLRLIWTYDTTLASEVLRAMMYYGYKALRPEWLVDIQTNNA